jgi:LAS superfamily LD-carboxypeptidase LdcB
MKSLLICLAALLCSSTRAAAQSSNAHKDPTIFLPSTNPGEGIVDTKSDSRKLDREAEQPARPVTPLSSANLAQIKRDSDELSRLAQSISNEISASEKGMLPKDLSENLKKIQKLSKRLHDELKL